MHTEIPTCALDPEGMRVQKQRYGRLGADVLRVRREPEALVIEFRDGFDRDTLQEALAVERECCPFFLFDLDEEARRLRASVRERDQLPALEAIAHALGHQVSTKR